MNDVSLVVGFDLDLTLVESTDGVVATLIEAGRRVGAKGQPAELVPLMGLPLDDIFRTFVPEDRVEEARDIYRELYPVIGVPSTKILPGASQAVEAVRHHRGEVLVVSAKIGPAVQAVLDHVELTVDDVVGERFSETKGEVLQERGADVFVGDHPGDMTGARAVGVYAMGVTTGWHDDLALRRAGADVVFADLLDFPYWLDDFVGNPS